MKTFDLNKRLIDSYLALLQNLSPGSKLDLISKLTQSVKSDIKNKEDKFEKAFGAWDKSDKAEDLIKSIRESRTFYRQIENL